ncbi:fimbrial protein [Salmonella enterica]|nr:fimbrial protein [Salmonella enterica]
MIMKKTLIALVVAGGAIASGSAMAWAPNGIGGTVELGGTLTPQDVVTPWEIKVGDKVTDLNADIKKGQSTVGLSTNKSIEILGIRTKDGVAFAGESDIAPIINYGGAIDASKFTAGETPLTLPVKDDTGQEIGTLKTSLFAQAYSSEKSSVNPDDDVKFFVYSESPTSAFHGGLGESPDAISTDDLASSYMPEAEANFTNQDAKYVDPQESFYGASDKTYSGYYFSVIKPNQRIEIDLNKPVTGDTQIKWNASLPITISYQ